MLCWACVYTISSNSAIMPHSHATYSHLRRRYDEVRKAWKHAHSDRAMWGRLVDDAFSALRAHPAYKAHRATARARAKGKRREAKRLRAWAAKRARAAVVAASRARLAIP